MNEERNNLVKRIKTEILEGGGIGLILGDGGIGLDREECPIGYDSKTETFIYLTDLDECCVYGRNYM